MNYYSTNPNADRIVQVQGEIDEVKKVMVENIGPYTGGGGDNGGEHWSVYWGLCVGEHWSVYWKVYVWGEYSSVYRGGRVWDGFQEKDENINP